MRQTPMLDAGRVITPSETAFALKLVTEMDLLRLKAIAKLHSRGLPADVSWEDLLQEAFARVISGSRRRPQGVAMIAFMAGVMRSLKAEHWRRTQKASDYGQMTWLEEEQDVGDALERRDPFPDPERSLAALQELEAIDRLFADDHVALLIITGLGDGLSAEEIRIGAGLSQTDYDSARRRMRRLLLREGLTSCRQK
jgi:DNA-directed RNA polymerase specialized sigma24 family protein